MAKVEMEIDSVRHKSLSDERVVILKAKGAERYLPIYIGSHHADIIGRLLTHEGHVDSAYFDLSSSGYNLTFSDVESATVSRFTGNVFYSKLSLAYCGKSLEVDCPTAKAIALAVRAGAPIFAAEEVLGGTAIAFPA